MGQLLKPMMATLLGICLILMADLAPAQPRPMAEDVYTPIAQGYDFLQAGNYQAAERAFETALKRDRYNPFALNNLAALREKQGHLQEALAYLVDAQLNAKDYLDKVQQTCFVGGLCAGVKPLKKVGATSAIATVIAENLKKLQDKMAKNPLPPKPSTPPAPAPGRR
ncbi:MAG: tetratricopeptide repeat protein [Thermodesulfobacteriota bacterium]